MCLAVPGNILSIHGEGVLSRKAKVSFGGAVSDVSLAYVPQAQVGDYVVVHVGFALSKVDPAEAEKLLAAIDEIKDLAREERERGPVK